VNPGIIIYVLDLPVKHNIIMHQWDSNMTFSWDSSKLYPTRNSEKSIFGSGRP
jgi:hypothetical protein